MPPQVRQVSRNAGNGHHGVDAGTTRPGLASMRSCTEDATGKLARARELNLAAQARYRRKQAVCIICVIEPSRKALYGQAAPILLQHSSLW